MFCSSAIDWTVTAAWAQAILSGLAIFAAVRLQDRDRRLRTRERERDRLEAVLVIADSCIRTLRNLDKRAQSAELTSGKYGHYEEETTADLTSISAIDLSQVENPDLAAEIIILRRAVMTARRRLMRSKEKILANEEVTRDRFESQLKRSVEARSRISDLRKRLS